MGPGISVGVVIIKDNKFLLGKRNPSIVGGNYWCLPMGRLEWGESLIECAKREVKEESGIEVRELKPLAITNVILENSHYITLGFLAIHWQGEPKITAPEEIVEWNWFEINKFPNPMFQPSREIIEAFLQVGIISEKSLIEIKNLQMMQMSQNDTHDVSKRNNL